MYPLVLRIIVKFCYYLANQPLPRILVNLLRMRKLSVQGYVTSHDSGRPANSHTQARTHARRGTETRMLKRSEKAGQHECDKQQN